MNVLFASLAAALVALAVWLLRERSTSLATGLVVAVILAVAYDDAIIAAGAVIGQGDLLFGLNVGRYLLHVALTPLLVVAIARLLRERGIRFLSAGAAWGTYAGLVAIGAITTLGGFELVYQEAMGVVRYVEPDPIPPIPAIATVLVLIVAGVRWRRAGHGNALLVASVVMTLVSAMPQPTPPWPSNVGEVILLAGIALTVRTRAVEPSAVLTPSTNPTQSTDPAGSVT